MAKLASHLPPLVMLSRPPPGHRGRCCRSRPTGPHRGRCCQGPVWATGAGAVRAPSGPQGQALSRQAAGAAWLSFLTAFPEAPPLHCIPEAPPLHCCRMLLEPRYILSCTARSKSGGQKLTYYQLPMLAHARRCQVGDCTHILHVPVKPPSHALKIKVGN